MDPFVAQVVFEPDPVLRVVLLALASVFWLALVCGILFLIYFLLTLPLRRTERARLILDLIELGISQGQTPEATLSGAAASRDGLLGARFQLLAANLKAGLRLSLALSLVPRLLPPQVTAILQVGERIANIPKVIPACRKVLADSVSQVRGALNYLLLLTLIVTPATLVFPIVIRYKVLPAYRSVFGGMFEGAQLPAFTRLIFSTEGYFLLGQAVLLVFTWLLMLAYVGGPRFQGWLRGLSPVLVDAAHFLLPWRRKRLQRDFTAVLAVLLDAGLPEAEALRLAADCANNAILRKHAEKACGLLTRGVKLTEAIRAIDDAGELRWRLANALHRGSNFLNALNGWHDSLDAKAFQQEQAAAQLTTTALVLYNGLVVGSIVLAVFLPLVQLLHSAALW